MKTLIPTIADYIARKRRYGFTLIEIAIVILIIGFLASGVLVGRDLIAGAKIRSTVSTKQEFDVAVYTFKSRYMYLPGDIRVATGIPDATPRTGSDGNSDGDGLIEVGGLTYDSRYINLCGETLTFWSDLYKAQMIKAGGASAPGTAYPGCLPTSVTPESGLRTYIPASDWR